MTAFDRPVTQAEHEQRWGRLRDACAERGLDGVVVWSKGGHADSAGDVFWLANYYPRFNRSQAALIVPLDGEPALVADVADVRRDLIAVEDVHFSLDVPGTVGELLAARRAGRRLGLVGGAALLAATRDALAAACDGVTFEPLDDAVLDLRVVKSAAELDCMRRAARAGDAVFAAMMEAALEPGTSEAQVAAAGYAAGVARGVVPIDAMMASGPASEYFAHGQLPRWSDRRLEAGDLFHVDHAGVVGGYMYDFARSCVTGGSPSEPQLELLEGAIAAVEAGVAAVRPGVSGAALYDAVGSVLDERGLMTGQSPLMGHGHGIGIGFEWPFLLPFERREAQAGMVLAVECMAGRPGVGAVYFEQNVLVTQTGAELLTTCRHRYW